MSSGTPSLSFEYRYQLAIILTDSAGDADTLMVSLLERVGVHQRDLLTYPERRQSGIRFEVDFINHDMADYSTKIDSIERVIVKQDEHAHRQIQH